MILSLKNVRSPQGNDVGSKKMNNSINFDVDYDLIN